MPQPPSVSLNGDDTLIINGRFLRDFGDGDVAVAEFPNDIMKVKIGKNGNAIFALDNMGRLCRLSPLKVLRGSPDDIFLNDLLQGMIQDPTGFVLMDGQLTKRIGLGDGSNIEDIYALAGGVFDKQVGAKSNVEGDTEQALSSYSLVFTQAVRAQF